MVLTRRNTQNRDQDLHTLWSLFLSFKDYFLSSATMCGWPDDLRVSRTCAHQIMPKFDHSLGQFDISFKEPHDIGFTRMVLPR